MGEYTNDYDFVGTIHIEPLSLNNMQKSRKGGERYDVPNTKKWKDLCFYHLCQFKKELAILQENFCPKKQCLFVSYEFYLPPKKLLTKDLKINQNSGDHDNYVKPFQDQLFRICLPDLDDSMIVRGTQMKLPAKEPRIVFGLKVKNLADIPEFMHFLDNSISRLG